MAPQEVVVRLNVSVCAITVSWLFVLLTFRRMAIGTWNQALKQNRDED
ncbi:MAG: hypothetical protein MUF49_20385 [Oculatellaceae cyanobacterium Prado106]|jgi:hypothetical protein|nr:hypothetical protein [Oculatellaceae cyanobacterium Prado106]